MDLNYFHILKCATRDGLQPMDLDVGKWLRKHAPGIKTVVVLNKSESLDDGAGSMAAAIGEAHMLGFGDPIALSAETGLGMAELYETLRPLLEHYMLQVLNGKNSFMSNFIDVNNISVHQLNFQDIHAHFCSSLMKFHFFYYAKFQK